MNELRKYESFDSITEMDNFISKALGVLEIRELDRKILRLLAGYSCKFIGVSFLKVQTIADKLVVSYKTAQRALKRLKEIGIIKRIRTIRSVSGGFGSSITVIRPIALTYRERANESVLEGAGEPKEQRETFFLKAYLKDIKYIRQQEEIDFSYLAQFVPEEFIQAVKPFVTPEEAFILWGKVQVCSRKYAPDVLSITKPAIEAFKASVLAHKVKRIKKSFGAYFWGALSGVLAVEQRKVVIPKGIYYNWLD